MTRVGNASSEPVMPAVALALTASMKSRGVDLKKGRQSVRNRLIVITLTQPN